MRESSNKGAEATAALDQLERAERQAGGTAPLVQQAKPRLQTLMQAPAEFPNTLVAAELSEIDKVHRQRQVHPRPRARGSDYRQRAGLLRAWMKMGRSMYNL